MSTPAKKRIQKNFRQAIVSWNLKTSVLVADEKGRLFQIFRVDRPDMHVQKRVSPWSCWKKKDSEGLHIWCRHNLTRIHWTCFHCRIRRVIGGEIPWILPVNVQCILLANVPLWKNKLRKKAMTLLETFLGP